MPLSGSGGHLYTHVSSYLWHRQRGSGAYVRTYIGSRVVSAVAHSDLCPAMRPSTELRCLLALCTIAAVEAVVSPKVFIIDYVRRFLQFALVS